MDHKAMMSGSGKFCIEAYNTGAATHIMYRDTLEEAKFAADECITVMEWCGADVYVDDDPNEDDRIVYSVSSKVPGVIDGREHEAPPPMPAPTLGFYAGAALYAAFPYIVMAITLPVWGPVALWQKVMDIGKPKPVYRGTVRPIVPLCKDAHSFPDHWDGEFPTNCSNCGVKMMGVGG
jgi:hypothetical protein